MRYELLTSRSEANSVGGEETAERLRGLVLEAARSDNPGMLRDPEKFKEPLRLLVNKVAAEAGITCSEAVHIVMNDILGYGPIQPLLKDPKVNEVRIYRYDCGEMERDGRYEGIDKKYLFMSEEHLRRTASKIAGSAGKQLNESSPKVDADLPDGSRVNIKIPPISKRGVSMTIRKFPRFFSFEEMIGMKFLSGEAGDFIKRAVETGLNIIVCGPMGSGKTTLVNALTGLVETDILTIEDPVELQPFQKKVVQLEARPANIEGKGEIPLSDLVKDALRNRPGLLILGECRGGEAYYVLSAMSTGTQAFTTVHANSSREAIFSRLPVLISMSEEGRSLDSRTRLALLAMSIDIVIFIGVFKVDGKFIRRVVEISEVIVAETPQGDVPEVNVLYSGLPLEERRGPLVFAKRWKPDPSREGREL